LGARVLAAVEAAFELAVAMKEVFLVEQAKRAIADRTSSAGPLVFESQFSPLAARSTMGEYESGDALRWFRIVGCGSLNVRGPDSRSLRRP